MAPKFSTTLHHLTLVEYLLCFLIFARRNNKTSCKRSHFIRGLESKEPTKEAANIYCQNFINHSFYCQSEI